MIDTVASLRAYLAVAIPDAIVRGEELTDDDIKKVDNWEARAVVIDSAGGSGAPRTFKVDSVDVVIRCYAESPYEARRLYNRTKDALRFQLRPTAADVVLFQTTETIGPNVVREPGTRWALAFGTWNVRAAALNV